MDNLLKAHIYSPNLNPIEQVFAKLKTLLRKVAAQTIKDTWKGIGNVLDAFTPQEHENYIKTSDMLQSENTEL